MKRIWSVQPRSIRLPQFVWEALDVDAARCRRSAVRQIEAILVRYYDLVADIELNEEKLSQAAKSVSRKRKAG
jgi:hypothetical protein